jgi:Leucine-rich repeat (LRR) protein
MPQKRGNRIADYNGHIDYCKIKRLYLNDRNLYKLPDLSKYTNLELLDCSYNNLKSIDYLPVTLKYLYCNNNHIKSIDNLPINLEELYCDYNDIESLDNLPYGLKLLRCKFTKVASLDNLPPKLSILDCTYNKALVKLHNLPNSLVNLYCDNHEMLDDIPDNLIISENYWLYEH